MDGRKFYVYFFSSSSFGRYFSIYKQLVASFKLNSTTISTYWTTLRKKSRCFDESLFKKDYIFHLFTETILSAP